MGNLLGTLSINRLENFPKALLVLLVVFLFVFIISGCQPKVYLMPSPVGIKPDSELFNLSEINEESGSLSEFDNLLFSIFATNRQPIDNVNKSGVYSIFPSDTLKLGFTVHRVGDPDETWEEILEQSVRTERSKKLLLTSEYTRQVASFNINDDEGEISPQAQGLFDLINRALERVFDKDILVYVHGANCNFYRATAQGAQFFHFTGHNTLVLSFSWPSAENILKYKTDVMHAEKTVPAFARLIELLSTHTKARKINILAYSAGAQVAAPGLAYFRDKYPDTSSEELKQKLRIGEVYFAAPDTAFEPFIERYLKFRDIVERTTINLNENDAVLKLSAFQNGVSRLGKPDAAEISEKERDILIDWLKSPKLNVIDVGKSEPLHLGKAHDSWYSHPWVSADVLMLLLFNLDPIERGLHEYWIDEVAKTYRFPPDYDVNLRRIVDENRNMLEERVRIKHGQ